MATITVGENSYVTETELSTYATDRGVTISGDTSVLLIKAMDFIESRDSMKSIALMSSTDVSPLIVTPRSVAYVLSSVSVT